MDTTMSTQTKHEVLAKLRSRDAHAGAPCTNPNSSIRSSRCLTCLANPPSAPCGGLRVPPAPRSCWAARGSIGRTNSCPSSSRSGWDVSNRVARPAGLAPFYEEEYRPVSRAIRALILSASDKLARRMLKYFGDEKAGGLFLTSSAHTELLARTKPGFDGQEPAPNAAAARALWRLSRMLDNADYAHEAERILHAFASAMQQMPRGFIWMLGVLDEFYNLGPEIVIMGAPEAAATRALWHEVYARYLPGSVLVGADPAQTKAAELAKKIPLLADRTLINNQPAAYVCRNRACQKPVTAPEELRRLLP